MTREKVEAKIKQILVQDFSVDGSLIADEATFGGTLRMDSLDIVDFIMLLHKDLAFSEEMSRYREVENFGALVDFVHQRLPVEAGESDG